MNQMSSSQWSDMYTSELEEMANEIWDKMQVTYSPELNQEYEAIMKEIASRGRRSPPLSFGEHDYSGVED